MHSGVTGMLLMPLSVGTKLNPLLSMAASREKLKAARSKKLAAKAASTKLLQPVAASEKVAEKIKVSAKSKSALVPGSGQSMGMEID